MRPIAILFSLLSGISQAQPTFSPEKEAALGAQLAADLRRQTKPIENPSIQAYAQYVGNRLSGHAGWHFEVVTGLSKRPTEITRWFPGGYFFIPAELFLNSRNEYEFAGMLAHAVAHVASHDMTRATVQGLGSIPLVFANWDDSLAVPHVVAAAQRKLEVEANVTAIRLMRDAGYNAEAIEQAPTEGFQAIQKALSAELPRTKPSLFK